MQELFNLPDLLREIGDTYVGRGRAYQREGRVLSVMLDPELLEVTAQVRGSGRNRYTQAIRLTPGRRGTRIDGDCTCPMAGNCKHVAAALLEVLRLGAAVPLGAADADEIAPIVPVTPRAQLSAELGGWLATVRQVLVPPEPGDTYPANVRHRLLYVLKAGSQRPAAVQVMLYSAQEKQDGSYGQVKLYQSNPYLMAEADARYILAIDRELIAGMLTLSYQNGAGSGLTGTGGAELLRRMVGTGRCHWDSAKNPPLTLGEPVPVRFAWEVADDGGQQLRVALPFPGGVAGVTPPWYVDTDAWRTGPTDSGLAPELAAALLAAPTVGVEFAAMMNEALAAAGPTSKLPLPAALAQRTVTDLPPTPWLTLGSYTLSFPHRGARRAPDAMLWDCAQLSFDYLGARVVTPLPATVTRRRDQEILRIVRQPKVEKAARQQLMRAGLHQDLSVASVFGAPFDPRAGEAWSLTGEDGWMHFMIEAVPRLRAEGWRIDMAGDFRFNVIQPDDWQATIEEIGNDWFGLEMGIRVDGETVSLLPMLADLLAEQPALRGGAARQSLARDAQFLVRLDESRVLALPARRVADILGTLLELYERGPAGENRLHLSRYDAARLADLDSAVKLRWFGGDELIALGRRLRDFAGIRPALPPAGFQATLRPYQQQGLNWLQFLREYGLAGVLADDMGLGKTIQTLAHLLIEKQSGRADRPSLVIAPTSLMHNWKAEAARFAPDLRVLILQGTGRKQNFERLREYDLVLTTYPLLSRDKDTLMGGEYHLLVLDEAQNIKNPKAQAALIAGHIKARHRLCLTGTPMENHLGELWSLFNFLMPGVLGDQRQFTRGYRTPIEKQGDEERRASLSRRVAPFLLRRTKEMVAAELPPKTEILRTVQLSDGQRDLYETIRAAMHEKVRQQIAAKGLARSHIVVLDALLKLRQVCCDPRLVKLEKARRVAESAKRDLLMTMLPELLDEGRRVLIFSQFTSMLALIEADLAKENIDYALLTGDTKDRRGAIEAFQSGRVPVFLVSLKAGGVGLNLTAADTVIHYDPWWNPAVENQATDRAHRIGQDKPVFVYKLIAAGSVEEKIVDLQTRKAKLADSILAGKGEIGAALSSADLEVLFEPLTRC